MLAALSHPIMGYTLMAARAGQQPIRVFARMDCSETAYMGPTLMATYSESTIYLGAYPDNYNDNTTSKLGDSPR